MRIFFQFSTFFSILGLVLTSIFLLKIKFLYYDVIVTTKPKYFRYEFVDIKVLSKIPLENPPKVFVFKNNRIVETIGKRKIFKMKFKDNIWFLNWPPPWNPPLGRYSVQIYFPGIQRYKLKSTEFEIVARPKKNLKPVLAVDFENIKPLQTIKIKNPDGEIRNYKGLIDWTKFVGGNTLWILGAATLYYQKLDEGFPFVSYNFPLFEKIADECHKENLKFGVWIMCYLTDGNPKNKPNYKFAIDYDPVVGIFESRAISILDTKRVEDLKNVVKKLSKIDIDYIGLDYIRNALGGYECVDEFVKDMDVETPKDWQDYTKDQRMIWLAKKKIARKDKILIDQWQWWRAHKISKIIAEIKPLIPNKKILWCFTLSWEKGWQHGQDPIMFHDAGMDLDAVMLYEADKQQFENLIKEWNNYVKKHQLNIIVGDVIDFPLHQNQGPEEYLRRNIVGIKKIYNDGITDGVFIHCLSRGLWGRLGPYKTIDWLTQAQTTIQEWKKLTSFSDF